MKAHFSPHDLRGDGFPQGDRPPARVKYHGEGEKCGLPAWWLLLAAVGAWLGSVGCVSSVGPVESDLPPDWIAAWPTPGAPAADIAGVFVELGEQLDQSFVRDGTVGIANLFTALTTHSSERGIVRRPPDRGATVELRRVDDSHVEMITRVNDVVVRQITLDVGFEKDTGTTILHRGQAFANGAGLLAAGYATATVRLWRAPDGRLNARFTRGAIGGALLVPFQHSEDAWCRWDRATPAAMARQVAALTLQAEAEAHAAELNRRRATVGTKAPDFASTDVLTGRSVTSADYNGKAVVLHVWYTGGGSRPLRTLRAAHAKFHDRGLEIVGLCLNPANEREKVIRFIKSEHLTWPQIHDGQGTHAKLFEATYGASSPSYCVIDRHGNIAAFAVGDSALNTAVATALAQN